MSGQIKEAEAKAVIEEEKRRQQVSNLILLPPQPRCVNKSLDARAAQSVYFV